MESKQRIYADFQKLDDHDRLVLSTLGTKRDLEKAGITLRSGLELEFYTEDDESTLMLVDGVVSFDDKAERWVAKVNWDEIRRVAK